MLLLSLFNHT